MSGPESKPATFTYDPEANAAYIELAGPIPSGGVARTVLLGAAVDFDADGNALGVEILGLYLDGSAPGKTGCDYCDDGYKSQSPCACLSPCWNSDCPKVRKEVKP